jgi:SNF2 family DNA or RNA helicase
MQIKVWQDMIAAQLPYECREQVMRDIPGARWNTVPRADGSMAKFWTFPKSPVVAAYLVCHFGKLGVVDEIKQMALEYEEARSNKYRPDAQPIPGIVGVDPWQHQRQAYWWGLNLDGLLLAFEMGVGKSLTTVGLVANSPHARVLIACPKSVVSVWPNELARSSTPLPCLALDKGSVKARASELKKRLKLAEARREPLVVAINYDSFWREGMRELLLEVNWDVLVCDEIHRLKSHNGRASKFAALLGTRVKKRIGLTGTPMPHSPLDIFAQYRVLDPGIFGTNFHKFRMRYARMGGFGGKQVIGYQNEEELTARFKSIAFQAGKELLDLPPFIHNYRTCELNPKTQKVYEALDKKLFAEIESGQITAANAMVKVLRLQQLTGGYLKLDDGTLEQYGTEKKDLLADILEDIPQDEPVIVFARFTADIANIKEAMSNAKRTCGELSGHANDLKAWQDGEFNSLAVQIRSGGVGVSLVRSSYCIYYSVGHSLGDYLQSLDRTHRPGQKSTVRYYHLLADGTIDQKVYKALMAKRDVVETIMDKEAK